MVLSHLKLFSLRKYLILIVFRIASSHGECIYTGHPVILPCILIISQFQLLCLLYNVSRLFFNHSKAKTIKFLIAKLVTPFKDKIIAKAIHTPSLYNYSNESLILLLVVTTVGLRSIGNHTCILKEETKQIKQILGNHWDYIFIQSYK